MDFIYSDLKPTAAYEFFDIFTGMMSQHLTADAVERAKHNLAQAHKYITCLKYKVIKITLLFKIMNFKIRKMANSNKFSKHDSLLFYQGLSTENISGISS